MGDGSQPGWWPYHASAVPIVEGVYGEWKSLGSGSRRVEVARVRVKASGSRLGQEFKASLRLGGTGESGVRARRDARNRCPESPILSSPPA